MMRLRGSLESLPRRRQAFLAILAVLLLAVLYLWLVQSAARARVQLKASVATLREQASRLEQQAAEYERLREQLRELPRPAPASAADTGDLAALVRTKAGAAGLSRALVRIDAPDPDRVQVAFGAVEFADWLTLAASLQALQIRLETCRIEAMSTPGLVSVTTTFARAGAR